jgi:hypothetical protein
MERHCASGATSHLRSFSGRVYLGGGLIRAVRYHSALAAVITRVGISKTCCQEAGPWH